MPDPVIDRTVYDDLKETVGDDFFQELVDTFLIDTTALVKDLGEALEKNQTDTVRRTAHSLKSNSATFGAARLSQLAKEMEFMAKDGKLEDGGAKLTDISDEYRLVKQEIEDINNGT
jgi:HPt (histidine-containing phosphotransfer) domain-containing protein